MWVTDTAATKGDAGRGRCGQNLPRGDRLTVPCPSLGRGAFAHEATTVTPGPATRCGAWEKCEDPQAPCQRRALFRSGLYGNNNNAEGLNAAPSGAAWSPPAPVKVQMCTKHFPDQRHPSAVLKQLTHLWQINVCVCAYMCVWACM